MPGHSTSTMESNVRPPEIPHDRETKSGNVFSQADPDSDSEAGTAIGQCRAAQGWATRRSRRAPSFVPGVRQSASVFRLFQQMTTVAGEPRQRCLRSSQCEPGKHRRLCSATRVTVWTSHTISRLSRGSWQTPLSRVQEFQAGRPLESSDPAISLLERPLRLPRLNRGSDLVLGSGGVNGKEGLGS
ncbi:hypothetical protein BJY00DRAFT_282204 [Aspergillus carlsbadensis]|nr:hypothetical protein BJY00DRAFT_282204 [Aspergillus carlsbadensis]